MRITAVSQEHVLVCTYNTQSNKARKWYGFIVGIEIDSVVWVVKMDMISVVGIGVDLISV